jgi:hypothetical protein
MLRDPEIDAVLTAVAIELNGAVLLAAVRADKHCWRKNRARRAVVCLDSPEKP